MQTFDQALYRLYSQGLITYEDALAHADSKNDLRLLIKLRNETDLGSLSATADDLLMADDPIDQPPFYKP